WFWTDGWLNLEYFAALCTILYWWRPTSQNYRYSLEELAGDEQAAMERDQNGGGHDSFDNPRMGEDLELGEFGGSVAKNDNRKASFSADDVQFVINNDEFESGSDSEDNNNDRNEDGDGNHIRRAYWGLTDTLQFS
ncbi:hypothetical protein GGF37_001260, partial [Kickxella alabastrina]